MPVKNVTLYLNCYRKLSTIIFFIPFSCIPFFASFICAPYGETSPFPSPHSVMLNVDRSHVVTKRQHIVQLPTTPFQRSVGQQSCENKRINKHE
jgi:hypothetical protein